MTEPHRDHKEQHWRALPLWLWMLLMTAAIVALLMYVGRSSFAA